MENNSFYILKVPLKWKDIYKHLLQLMSKFGIDIIKDCNAVCSKNGKKLIECYTTFNVACVAYDNENIKEAKLLIQILIEDLNKFYNCNLNVDYYIDIDTEIIYNYFFDSKIFKLLDIDVELENNIQYKFDDNIFTTLIDETDNQILFDNNIFKTI